VLSRSSFEVVGRSTCFAVKMASRIAERQAPNAERRAPNAKRQTPNALSFASIRPLPAHDFWFIDTAFVGVAAAGDPLVPEFMFGVCTGHLKPRHPIDRFDCDTETVDSVANRQLKWRYFRITRFRCVQMNDCAGLDPQCPKRRCLRCSMRSGSLSNGLSRR
jgi:hypothetical protein